MNQITKQSWMDDYAGNAQLPIDLGETDWIETINEVTKFDNRNKGHSQLWNSVDENANILETSQPSLPPVIMRSTDIRERNIIKEGRGRGIPARNGSEIGREVGVNIQNMISHHLGTAHRLDIGERCDGSSLIQNSLTEQLNQMNLDEDNPNYLIPTLLCDICGEMCQRGVLMPCCGVQACRYCAIKKITDLDSNKGRKCWECNQGPIKTEDLVIDEDLREHVKQFNITENNNDEATKKQTY